MRYLAVAFRELAPAVEPVPVVYSPTDKAIPAPKRDWKYLIEMNYNELHAALGNEIGKTRRRRVRV